MTTTPDADPTSFRTGVWLLPVFGALTLWATLTHQRDPTTEFSAFAQPAIGNLEIQGYAGADDVYDDVYGIPAFVTPIGGAVVFSVASILLARAAAAIDGMPRWARVAYGASGPLIGFLGIAFGPLQTLGSLAAVAGGVGIAATLRRTGATNHTATP